jgi:hypothetical protein
MLKVWNHYVGMYLEGKARLAEPCSADETVPSTGVRDSANCACAVWAGYGVHNAAFTDVEAEWTVPNAGKGLGLSSHWVGVGLGESKTYPLVQAGEESPAGGKAYAWVETWYPGDKQGETKNLPGLTNIGGNVLSVHVTFTTAGVGIHITDETTVVSSRQLPQTYSGMIPDGHSEVISEDPNQEAQPLADFGNVTFTQSQAYSPATGWKPIGQLSHYYYTMSDIYGNVMARPGPLDSTGYDFTNYWEAAG